MFVPDEASEHLQIPGRVLRNRQEQVCFGLADRKRGNAGVRCLKELACVAERISKRVSRFPDVSQLSAQAIEELECRELTI